MKKKDDQIFLRHIFDSIKRIEEYLLGFGYENFKDNHLVQDGVIRQLEIIGEASKKLSKNLTSKYNQVPWKQITGMRDKLIHEYFGVDFDAIWDTAKNDIPKLLETIEKIKNEFGYDWLNF